MYIRSRGLFSTIPRCKFLIKKHHTISTSSEREFTTLICFISFGNIKGGFSKELYAVNTTNAEGESPFRYHLCQHEDVLIFIQIPGARCVFHVTFSGFPFFVSSLEADSY